MTRRSTRQRTEAEHSRRDSETRSSEDDSYEVGLSTGSKRKRVSGSETTPTQVFGHLDVEGLVSLLRVSWSFRNTLLDREFSREIWVKALEEVVPTVPPCPEDLTEPAYAMLLFGYECQFCPTRSARGTRLLMTWRMRACFKCLEGMFSTKEEPAHEQWHEIVPFWSRTRTDKSVLDDDDGDYYDEWDKDGENNTRRRYPHTGGRLEWCHTELLRARQEEFENVPDGEKEAWKERKRAEYAIREEHAQKVDEFNERLVVGNWALLLHKMEDLGLGPYIGFRRDSEDQDPSDWLVNHQNTTYSHRFLCARVVDDLSQQRITDAVWERWKDRIIEVAQKLKRIVDEERREAEYERRWAHVRDACRKYHASQPVNEFLFVAADIVLRPEIDIDYLPDNPLNHDPDDPPRLFYALRHGRDYRIDNTAPIADICATYREEKKQYLWAIAAPKIKEVLGLCREPPIIFIESVVALFMCRHCPDACALHWLQAIGHHCPLPDKSDDDRREEYTEEDWVIVKNSKVHRWNTPEGSITLNVEACRRMSDLLPAMGLDYSISFSDMDRIDPIFRCFHLSPPQPHPGRAWSTINCWLFQGTMLDWRLAAAVHSCEIHNLEEVDEETAEYVRDRMNEARARDRKTWSLVCGRCKFNHNDGRMMAHHVQQKCHPMPFPGIVPGYVRHDGEVTLLMNVVEGWLYNPPMRAPYLHRIKYEGPLGYL
ncbi:hypothetical protein CC1G_13992 [Coprinopsis cinerea okayama7|uniref:F-box domain-containing protein n=1 Tax=Coprinopsis cinerea (strain Okayama-7 / 130 / ATCC MYA-4618 / FGSC 9003) TaxID=240176 RepID=D6RKZ9_COPC7|nr:hypothetical protein CC1G_13992 [Coprinopsis cinerea okayama7\|eukprot:XP_002911953.1 hypothetical protein CC1G_13992 [Coprinopsis cinerea okayama7\